MKYSIKFVIVAEDDKGNVLEQVNEEFLDSLDEAVEYLLALREENY